MPGGNEPAVRYFALIDDERGYLDGVRARRITGLVRRTDTRTVPTDEALGADFTWRPTDYLRRYNPRTDGPHEEISVESAEQFIASWRASSAERATNRSAAGSLPDPAAPGSVDRSAD
ncbi:hypothetical protein [Nocardia camponoti]|uniref:Uncharacterized protein n=1 Tax=Nocardia camponoti TaxID=1616106 RepID=A0A917Q8A7_9NOCA|nr:hypothetical protein [Nocardia camponoti]GGK33938.1 hypothetical protein GCM10011591_02010 [Nocardia camponoti]